MGGRAPAVPWARDADALCRAIEAHFGLTTKLIVEGDADPRAIKRKKAAG
jgi:hypothetical protein